MGRVATTVDEQINKLRERGMILDYPDDKIKEILLDIGYYRLGFYWHYFEKDREHNFIENTKFSDVVSLYYFDADLRNILIKYINRIEINFRTKIIYYASNKYKDTPFWFADQNIVDETFVNNLERIYTETFISNNKALKKHHEKYQNDRYAPAWKTLEYLTFGSIYALYKKLKSNELKQQIAQCYGIRRTSILQNFFHAIKFIRNSCAHSGIIFDLHTPLGISRFPGLTLNDRHSLYTSIKVILIILEKISIERSKELKQKIEDLFNDENLSEKVREVIFDKTGYDS